MSGDLFSPFHHYHSPEIWVSFGWKRRSTWVCVEDKGREVGKGGLWMGNASYM
jgi:hypothetical protein